MSLWKRLGLALAGLLAAAIVFLLALHKPQTVRTEVWIDRPNAAVWAVLTDTSQYPSWNPEISSLIGPLQPGSDIEIVSGRGDDAMTFHPRLLAVQPNSELRWRGHLWVPGLFDGEHSFRLEEHAGRTHFIQDETFTGLLVGRLTRTVLTETATMMRSMNCALKQRTEAQAAPYPTLLRSPVNAKSSERARPSIKQKAMASAVVVVRLRG